MKDVVSEFRYPVFLYSVFDSVAETWAAPGLIVHNDKEAERSFQYLIDSGKFIGDPAGYQLFCVGCFDQASGDLVSSHRYVCTGRKSKEGETNV